MNLPCLIACFAALLAGSAVAAPAPASALSGGTPGIHLTLSKAIQLAIEKNLAIKVEAFNPRIADAAVTAELGRFDPELRSNFSQSMTRDAHGVEGRTGYFDLGVGGFTSLGSSYSLGVSTTAFDYRGYQSGAALSLNQPLLRGFGPDTNLAQLRIARNNRQSSEWAFRQQVIDVVTKTVFVYNDLYSALQNYEAARRSRELAIQFEKDEKLGAEAGVRTSLDIVTAQAEAASREEAVLLAQGAILENERWLKQLVTDDTKTLLETTVSIEPPPMPTVGAQDVEAGLRDALTARPDYQQALLDLKNRHITVVTARDQTLPRLDLAGSLNLLGVDVGDASSSFGFFGDRSDDPHSWSAGLIFRLPLQNRNARGKLTAAKLLDAQALLGLQQMEQAIIVDVANAATEIATARKRIDSTREALRLAKESLEAGQARHTAGTATPFEVLQLQKKLTDAEAAGIKAEADYRKAVSEYDRKTGTTIDRNAIVISAESASAAPKPAKKARRNAIR